MELQTQTESLNMAGQRKIVRSRWVCGRSLGGNAGSNAAGGMDVCFL